MRRRLQIAIECLREAEQLYESQENGSTTQPGDVPLVPPEISGANQNPSRSSATTSRSTDPCPTSSLSLERSAPLRQREGSQGTLPPEISGSGQLGTSSLPTATTTSHPLPSSSFSRVTRDSILGRSALSSVSQREGTPIAISRSRQRTPTNNLFQRSVPYPDRELPRSRRHSTRHEQVGNATSREWRHRFFCLAGPESDRTPTTLEKEFLSSQDLGEKFLTFVPYATSDAVKFQIELGYRKLRGVDFELKRSSTCGQGRLLYAADDHQAIPPVSILRHLRGMIYIVPKSKLVSVSDIELIRNDGNSNEADGCSQSSTADTMDSIESSDAVLNTPENMQGVVHNQSRNVTIGSSDAVLNTPENMQGVVHNQSRNDTIVSMSSTSSAVVDFSIFQDDFNSNIHTDLWDSFKASIYSDNPGVQPIQLYRDILFDQALALYMKDKSLNLLQRPDIRFHFEPARDLGGVTREYFSLLLKSMVYDNYDDRFKIFIGNEGHKLPCADSSLLRWGVFKGIGKLMAHSLIHTGIAGFGVSKAVARYLLTESIDSQEDWEITMDDISCHDLRTCIELIQNWTSDSPISEEQKDTISEQAAIAGFNAPLTVQNKDCLKKALIVYHVIDSRKAQLDDMKVAFRDCGILRFTKGQERLLAVAAFPPPEALVYSAEMIYNHIDFEGDSIEAAQSMVVQLLQELDNQQMRNLLQFWTALPVLPKERLTVEIGDFNLSVSTCLLKISIPDTMQPEDFISQMKTYIDVGSVGFGSV